MVKVFTGIYIMNQEYQAKARGYKVIIIILIIQFVLNILMRFLPIPVCRIPGVNIFLDFPTLYIFLFVLYLWPINLRLEKTDQTEVKDKDSSFILILKTLSLLIAALIIPATIIMGGISALVAPEMFDSSRFITIIIFAAIFPFHLYSNLIQRRNYTLLMCVIIFILPIFFDISLNSSLVKFQFLLTSVIGISIIWALYTLSLLSKPPIKLLRIVNYYPIIAKQKFPITYRRNILQMVALSGVATLLLLFHSYLSIPRIETFALFRPNFERVINLIKANKINDNLPCEYGYFSNADKNNIMIIRKNGDLVVKFPIFNIGFGDGLVAFVYRSNQLDCKQENRENQCDGFKPLSNSWYWEVY